MHARVQSSPAASALDGVEGAPGNDEERRSSDETSSDSEDDEPVVYARAKLVPKSTRPPAAAEEGVAFAAPSPTTPRAGPGVAALSTATVASNKPRQAQTEKSIAASAAVEHPRAAAQQLPTRDSPPDDAELAKAVSDMMEQIGARPNCSPSVRGSAFVRMKDMVWTQLVSEGWREKRSPSGSIFFPPGCTRENTRVWAKGMDDGVRVRYCSFPDVLRFLQRSSWHGPGWEQHVLHVQLGALLQPSTSTRTGTGTSTRTVDRTATATPPPGLNLSAGASIQPPPAATEQPSQPLRVMSSVAGRHEAVGSENGTAAKRPALATAKPALRGSRRGANTLAQRNAVARAAFAAAFSRTKNTDVGTLFDTCHVGNTACTAIQVATQHRLALVEQCSDAVLGDLARRNAGWSAELGTGTRQVFLLAEGEAKSTAVFSRHTDSQALVIHMFGTAKPCQERGYGTALLRLLQKFAAGAEIFVEVATSKIPAWWLSKAFLGTATKFSKPRLWQTTALLRWGPDTEAFCIVCRQGQTVHLCPFQNCSYESHRASGVQQHVQSIRAEQSAKSSRHQRWQHPTSFKGVLVHSASSTVKHSTATKQSGREAQKRRDHNQEQKWVRKIIALAKQTDRSGLPAKARTLFRTMKADLCKTAISRAEDSDQSSTESENAHICTDCGREFVSKRGLTNHRRHW
eukprot:COSAG02_NODE_5200_length_4546_cov_4.043850_4_plen_686_part_00